VKSARNMAIFLDRDGVLNRAIIKQNKPYPPANLEMVEILPGVDDALRRLKVAGFLLIAVTNQPDVARGTQRRENVEEINTYLLGKLSLDDILTCFEDGDDPRRKPNPGMLFEAAQKHHVDLLKSFMVGDRWKDIEAGQRAGCTTVFINNEYNERPPSPPADITANSLADATPTILADDHN